MARAYVAIGSNVGDRQAHVAAAREGLAALPRTTLAAMSRVYETEPVGPVPQGRFLNAVVMLDTQLSPRELHQALQALETRAGRPPRDARQPWGPRTLDLDLLLFDQLVLDEAGLTVPHPRMHERWFVLRPLVDVDPAAMHPLLGRTAAQLLSQCQRPQGK